MALAVWPCAQDVPERRSDRDAAAEIARRAIATYSEPGDLVVDPLCGDGTSLLEAIRQGRHALGVVGDNPLAGTTVLERIARARARGARGHAAALLGHPADLPQLLARQASGFLRRHRRHDRSLAVHPSGSADLILLLPVQSLLGRSGSQSGGARPICGEAFSAAATVLRPGGFLVISKSIRSDGGLPDLRSGTVRLCEELGLQYWQHVVALLVPIRDGQLPARRESTPSHAASTADDASHADVLVFRKPSPATASSQAAAAEAA